MIKQELLESIEKHVSLKVKDWRSLEKVIFLQEFSKGTKFTLKEFPMLSFVNKGILRMYYIGKNNKEITLNIYHNNNTLINQYIYLHNIVNLDKELLHIEVLDNCLLSSIEYHEIEKLCITSLSIEYLIFLLNEACHQSLSSRILAKLTLDTDERYLLFMEEIDSIKNKIKQTYLASYLGITPQTFCNLKRKYKK